MLRLFKSRKWTFIVFRDNSRPSIQFKLNLAILLLVPFLFMLLVFSSVWFMQSYQQTSREHQQALVLLGEQEDIIESLQSDLISLSMQTEEMQGKMKSLEALEEEIHRLTDSPEVEASISHAQEAVPQKEHVIGIASFSAEAEWNTSNNEENAYGGVNYDVSLEEMNKLTAQMENNLNHLRNQMPLITARLEQARLNVEEYQQMRRITPSIWPTKSKRVTSNFGYRKDPFTKRQSYHTGIDIGGGNNDPVYATADGIVTEADYGRAQGYYITLDHSNGIQTRYLHLNKILVNKGDSVQKGETIGLLGSTGRSTGPHLHYEVLKDNKFVDPRPFMGSTEEK